MNPPKSRRRMVLRLSIVALAAAAILPCLYLWVLKPAGSGPAGPPVPREAFETPWSQRKVLVLGIGDSVTAGFGASPGYAYFDRLIETPPGDWPEMQGLALRRVLPNLKALNLAVSGSTSVYHYKFQIDTLEVQPPDVFGLVVVTSGGNDLIHNYGRTPPKHDAMYGATAEQARPWIAEFD